MKVLVTGINGQLGHDVMEALNARGHTVIGTDIRPSDDFPCLTMDITNKCDIDSTFAAATPDAVIHCAAWTAVDDAEDDSNYKRVLLINAIGTDNIAMACREHGCKLLYLSTDYVFDGSGETPWEPDCTSYAPLNIYGKTKHMGEEAVLRHVEKHFIVRIAWLYGVHGANFVRTMLRLGKTHNTLRVVCDQIGTPTYTHDLARLLCDMIESEKYGRYHAVNEGGYISWCDFAKEIFRIAGMDVNVLPVTTSEYGLSKAARPHNSRLSTRKLAQNGFTPLPDWRDALKRYLQEIDG